MPMKRYPSDLSSGSLNWGVDSVVEPSPWSGLRKPQVVRSIRIAGSNLSSTYNMHGCVRIGRCYYGVRKVGV